MMETHTYKNFFVYCEPCRNWGERKHIIKETLDLAHRCHKKIVMCANQTRRLATIHNILNDLSIQSILIHPQLNHDEIQQYMYDNVLMIPLYARANVYAFGDRFVFPPSSGYANAFWDAEEFDVK